jgi:hypothetical protein
MKYLSLFSLALSAVYGQDLAATAASSDVQADFQPASLSKTDAQNALNRAGTCVSPLCHDFDWMPEQDMHMKIMFVEPC